MIKPRARPTRDWTVQDYSEHDGLALAAMVRDGDVTRLELVDAAIDRIERHDGTLNAIVYRAFDEAREAARKPLVDGPFSGVPFLVKDFGIGVAN
jgi:amidase